MLSRNMVSRPREQHGFVFVEEIVSGNSFKKRAMGFFFHDE